VRSFVGLVSVVQVLVLVTKHGQFGEDHSLVQKELMSESEGFLVFLIGHLGFAFCY
jgi:hypothetical protein